MHIANYLVILIQVEVRGRATILVPFCFLVFALNLNIMATTNKCWQLLLRIPKPKLAVVDMILVSNTPTTLLISTNNNFRKQKKRIIQDLTLLISNTL